METMRRDGGGKRQPDDYSTARRKDQPATSFEGMNYEQKRRPYRENENEEKGLNGNSNNNRHDRRQDL